MTEVSQTRAESSAASAGRWPTAALCGLALLLLCAWFWPLAARHLLRTDEGRYAEIAREMFASGDWVTIRYNGLKYFEKPPFHLWMTALAYRAFGVGEWQARLWVATSGVVGLALTVLSARRWYGAAAGWLAGLVLLAAPSWNLGSHFNSLDLSVAAALAGVLAGTLLAQHPAASPPARRGWMWFAWGAAGIAVLTKGLIGIVLPGLVLIVYTLAARDLSIWRRLHLVSGGLLCLVITAPWFVLVSSRNPEFAQFFFIHEHWQRYTSTVHHRNAPAWYFLPQLLVGFLPWIGLSAAIVGVLGRPPGVPSGGPADHRGGGGFRPVVLLAVWVAVIFVFFSLSDSKLPGYILPIFPALAVLAALALQRLDGRRWGRQLAGGLVVAAAGLAASPLLGRVRSGDAMDALYGAYAVWVAAACGLAFCGIALAWWLNRAGRLNLSIATFGLAAFGAASVAVVGHESFGRPRSGADLVPALQAVLRPGMPIYSVRLLDHTLPFYLRRTTTMVESPDELDFGTRQEPAKWLPTLAAFEAVWVSGPPALAVMAPQTLPLLERRKLRLFVVARDPWRVVTANFPPPGAAAHSSITLTTPPTPPVSTPTSR